MKTYSHLFIDGRWQEPETAEMIDVIGAFSETVIGSVPAAGPQDVDHAARSARKAEESWAAAAPTERAAALMRIADGLEARTDEIAEAITDEVGMPLKLSQRIQVAAPVQAWRAYAKMAAELKQEEEIGHSLVIHEPVGVVACITPWNYPLHQITAKVAAALAAGCTLVLKPSEVAPTSAFILAEVIEAADLPAGVFNLVTGYGPVVGEALVLHPEVDMVSFTGSTAAGKRVAELAARSVKRVALELGGKSASVILDDADLATAVKSTLGSCFLNSGQTCTALTRMVVPEARYDEIVRLVGELLPSFVPGDPKDRATRLGPLASATQRERVRTFIREAVGSGTELLAGGPGAPEGLDNGFFVRPTVFGRVAPDAPIAQEEVFGPVLSILTYKDEEEAIAIANGVLYGLAGAVWGGDEAHARRIARRIQAGQVDVNGAPFNLAAPFGGFKQSGIGRENGLFGLNEFLETKALQLRRAAVAE